VSCNLPFAIVENDDFRHLLLDCPDRKDLRVMSRKTLAGRVRGVYCNFPYFWAGPKKIAAEKDWPNSLAEILG
jgi:hypothetical protein